MHLLVTGGAGFIGAHFIRHALSQPQVVRLVNLDCLTYAADPGRLGEAAQDSRYVFEKVDLRDEREVARVVHDHGITHVIHLAAETHVDRSIADARAFVGSNICGTHHLLEACRRYWPAAAPRVFVQVSTDEVYGSLEPDAPPFTEDSPLLPNSPYAASKAAADCLVRSYHQTHGLPAIITRSSNNCGIGQHAEKLIPTVVNSLRRRQPIPVYGDGRQVRDWLHVADHADALWRVLNRGRIGAVYNIGGGNEWANLQLVRLLCDLYDQQAGHPAGTSHALIEQVPDRPGHDRRYALSSARLREALGWSPEREFRRCLQELLFQGK